MKEASGTAFGLCVINDAHAQSDAKWLALARRIAAAEAVIAHILVLLRAIHLVERRELPQRIRTQRQLHASMIGTPITSNVAIFHSQQAENSTEWPRKPKLCRWSCDASIG